MKTIKSKAFVKSCRPSALYSKRHFARFNVILNVLDDQGIPLPDKSFAVKKGSYSIINRLRYYQAFDYIMFFEYHVTSSGVYVIDKIL